MQFQKRFTTLLKTQACYIKMGGGAPKRAVFLGNIWNTTRFHSADM